MAWLKHLGLLVAFGLGTFQVGVSAQSVEEINRRYDDFFHFQAEREKKENQRNQGRDAIRQLRLEHTKILEVARRDYVRSRVKQVEDPRLEREWDNQVKAWKQDNEAARRQFVKQRALTEGIVRKGRRIPEKLEFELED